MSTLIAKRPPGKIDPRHYDKTRATWQGAQALGEAKAGRFIARCKNRAELKAALDLCAEKYR